MENSGVETQPPRFGTRKLLERKKIGDNLANGKKSQNRLVRGEREPAAWIALRGERKREGAFLYAENRREREGIGSSLAKRETGLSPFS